MTGSTVRFQTEFDAEREVFPAPITVTSGGHAALAVVDCFARGEKILGRFNAGPGLIGLAVDSGDQPVDVTVMLHADRRTPEFYDRSLAHDAPRPHAPRVLVIRSQGRTRAAALLGRAPSDFNYHTRVPVRFRVEGSEINEDGLLVIELGDSKLDPEFGHAPYAACGIRIDTVQIALAPADPPPPAAPREPAALVRAGLVSTGLPVGGGRADLGGELFTVAPGGIGAWRLRARRVRPVRPDQMVTLPSAPWPRETAGAPKLRMRQKLVLLVKFRLRHAWHTARRRVGHLVAKAVRVADRPIGWLTGSRLHRDIEHGRLTARMALLDTGAAVPCTLTYAGWRTVRVTAGEPLTGVAVVRLAETPAHHETSFRYAWRLVGGDPA